LVVGRRLVLGGVELPWDMGLQGHSDADVICHALIDALCGAAGIGDIGTLFPDEDPKYRDARSLDLLHEVTDHCRRAKWAVENVDVTLLAQVPRLAAYREAIRNNLADVLGIDSVEPDLTLRGIRYAWDGIRRQTDAVLPESIARGPGT